MKIQISQIIGLCLWILTFHTASAFNEQDELIRRLEASEGKERVGLLNQLSSIFVKLNPDKAIGFASEAMEISLKANDLKGLADSYYNIGEGYKIKGENLQSLDYLLKSKMTYQQLEDLDGIANSSNSCGLIYRYLGDYLTALDLHQKSLKVYEKLGNKQGMAAALICLGVVERNLNNEKEAFDYYNRAIEISTDSKDNLNLVEAMVSKGNLYWYKGESDKAMYHYDEALKILAGGSSEEYEKSGILNNIGNVYRQKGELSTALEYYQRSLEISNRIGDKNMIAVTLKNMGITYKLIGEYLVAIKSLNESKNLAEKISLVSVQKEAIEQLSETYILLGDYKSALEYYKQFDLVKEAHARQQASDKISIMQLGYRLKEESQKQTIKEADLTLQVLKERNIRNIIIIITLFSVVIIFILWTRYRFKLRINQELRQLNTDLERRVEERTRQLREENERRKIAHELAEQANETKNRFLANISHEVRTPINAIIGFCDLTIKANIGEPHRMNLQRIKDSSEHLLALVKDLLDYSQLDYGQTELKKTSFNLTEILNSVINAFYLDVKSKKIELFLDIDKKVNPYLIGDKDAVRQILFNLVGNAIKFTEKGSVRVMVKVAEDYRHRDSIKLLFSVEDTGIGISKMKQRLIFMDFNKENDSTIRKYGGAGLGLTISKHFIELMEGKIWVESEKQKGSNFMFTLVIQMDPNPTVNAMENEANFHIPLHLLVAEDNLLNAQVISAFLARLGHTCSIASNGSEALKELTRNVYDAVLMDIEMPVMDGIEATRAIRKGKEPVLNPEIPIIALTAHALKDYEEKCFKAGMNNYLTKPVDIEQLSKILKSLHVAAEFIDQEMK